MRIITGTVLFCVLVFLTGGCTTSSDTSSGMMKGEMGERMSERVKIKASGSYEECIELKPGMVFDYYFDASSFVNFNIHYHAEDGIHYPVSKKGVMGSKGIIDPQTHDFYTPEQEFYCLMWDNVGQKTVKLSYSCTLRQMHRGGHMDKDTHMME